jgi:spermidine/putrescine transport system substrate-binding protein
MGRPLRLTRRELLRAAPVAAAAILAACDRSAPPIRLTNWDAWWRRQRTAGVVEFANWPYYIDRRRDDSHPSLDRFTSRTGIFVRYSRPIRDNARFLTRIAPHLREGASPYDLIVITNGLELSTLIEKAWLTPLDHGRLPNFARYASPLVRNPAWDPDNRYSVAWQSGFTGIAYRPEAVEALGRAPRGVHDLFDGRLRGRVGMMTDLLDLGSAGLLEIGVDPERSTPDQWREAARALREQRASGVVRGYYDQSYLEALERGEIWVSQAWSGDIYQANRLGHPELEFVVPSEGMMFWTDNLLIPRGAQHPADAIELMNFVYHPRIAAMIADWVWYVCPVPAARTVVERRMNDPETADSPLVFPTEKMLGPSVGVGQGERAYLRSPLRNYPPLATQPERVEWHGTFFPVAAG